MAKPSNSTSSGSEKKKKKRSKVAPNVLGMKLRASKDNPFESIWSRKKFDIIGKKHKGVEQRIGLARSRAIEKRKSTLLKEYKESGKSSVFVDKRIGEQDVSLGEFDKAIMRSQRERQIKLKRKTRFNLSDGEEDELDFQNSDTFFGRDDFVDEIQPDDEEIVEKASVIKRISDHKMHGVSTNEEDQRSKSRKEVMDEIIAKSKYFKAEKAKDKEEDAQFLKELDTDFTSLLQSSGFSSMTIPNKKNADLAKKSAINLCTEGYVLTADSSKQRQLHPYDKLVNEMTFEIRARPSDRTKRPDEVAQEEREQLEQLEEERQKRMHATEDSSDEDEDDCLPKKSTEGVKSISGDVSGDSSSVDGESRTKKGWVDEIFEREKADKLNIEEYESSTDSESVENENDDVRSDRDDDDNEKPLLLGDWEQSDDDNLIKDLSDEDGNEDISVDVSAHDGDQHEISMKLNDPKKPTFNALITKSIVKEKVPFSTNESLPFLIEAPNDFNELCCLLENKSYADVMEAISRVRKSNAISLTAENRRKIQRFYGLLLQYFAVLANKKPLDVNLLNLLVKPLMEMSVEVPYYAAICARDRLSRTRNLFCEAIKNPGKSCWPSLKTLLLFRLWSMMFPCSDFRHAVMTPTILLMCEYLMRCPILCGRDIAVGSFLCSMVLSVVKQSRKFCPEALIFLQTLLVSALDCKTESCHYSQFNSNIQIRDCSALLSLQDRINPTSLDFFMLMDMEEDSPFFSSDNFRGGILVSVMETLDGLVDAYKDLNSFPEIFSPVSTLLLKLAEHRHLPQQLHDKLKNVAHVIDEKIQEHHTLLRRPLQMRKKKPVPIKLFNPKFEERFVKGRNYDPDGEKVERRKLKKHIKRETKGAVRELRKDNYFLFEAKEKDHAIERQERSDKYGKSRAFLEQQEHHFKSGQLGKGKKRRRK